MGRRVMPFGLIASGVKGEKSINITSSGTVASTRSNRAALRRRVLKKCTNNKKKCDTNDN